MIVRITFLVIIKKILKWAENILSRNKLAGKKNTISKQERDNVDLGHFTLILIIYRLSITGMTFLVPGHSNY